MNLCITPACPHCHQPLPCAEHPLPRGCYAEQRADGSVYVTRILNWWMLGRQPRIGAGSEPVAMPDDEENQ